MFFGRIANHTKVLKHPKSEFCMSPLKLVWVHSNQNSLKCLICAQTTIIIGYEESQNERCAEKQEQQQHIGLFANILIMKQTFYNRRQKLHNIPVLEIEISIIQYLLFHGLFVCFHIWHLNENVVMISCAAFAIT